MIKPVAVLLDNEDIQYANEVAVKRDELARNDDTKTHTGMKGTYTHLLGIMGELATAYHYKDLGFEVEREEVYGKSDDGVDLRVRIPLGEVGQLKTFRVQVKTSHHAKPRLMVTSYHERPVDIYVVCQALPDTQLVLLQGYATRKDLDAVPLLHEFQGRRLKIPMRVVENDQLRNFRSTR